MFGRERVGGGFGLGLKVSWALLVSAVVMLGSGTWSAAQAVECMGHAPSNTCFVGQKANQPCMGTEGPDRIVGSPGVDVIYSGGGDDQISSGEGDDLICSGDGDDTINAGPGSDAIDAGAGNDHLDGGSGTDFLRGGKGVNTCVRGENLKGCAGESAQAAAEGKRGKAARKDEREQVVADFEKGQRALAAAKAKTDAASAKARAAARAPSGPRRGVVIDKYNLKKFSNVGGPSITYLISRGLKIEVGPYRRVSMPPPFVAATKRYSRQVTLAADSIHLMGHVAGLPFPSISSKDSQAGTKYVLNSSAAMATDDLDLRNARCRSGSVGVNGQGMRVDRDFKIAHFRRLFFRERLAVAPLPEMPNKDGVRYKEGIHPFSSPFDMRGTIVSMYRYLDPAREDETWMHVPKPKRIRRISQVKRSEALEGQDMDFDSFAGFSGNPASMKWRYLGSKTVLAPFHGTSLPVKWRSGVVDFFHEGAWEPRDVWVVEGLALSRDSAYSRRVLYIDKESYKVAYSEIYDWSGELWKVWVNNHLFAKSPIAGARYPFDYEMGFLASASMIDLKRAHATACGFPSADSVREQGWYINVGDREGTNEGYFDHSGQSTFKFSMPGR
jgi:hypothetical protein